MPNRILKESICTSDKIQKLSAFAEIFFYRLIVNADDFGRMDGRAAVLRSRLFPLKDVRNTQIEEALCELASVELVSTYIVDGKPFVRLLAWDRHQQIRAKKSKYPSPDETCNQLLSDDSNCPRNPIQSESNPNPNPYAQAREDVRPSFDTVEAYATSNLMHMSLRNMEELADFKNDLPDEMIRYAIDEACGNGARRWNYVKKILDTYLEREFKSVGDIKAYEDRRKAKQAQAEPQTPRVKFLD